MLAPLAAATVSAIFVYIISLLIVIDGMFILIGVVTIIMNFYLLYLLIKKSNKGANQYGENPLNTV